MDAEPMRQTLSWFVRTVILPGPPSAHLPTRRQFSAKRSAARSHWPAAGVSSKVPAPAILLALFDYPKLSQRRKYALTIRPDIDDRARPVAPPDAIPVVTG